MRISIREQLGCLILLSSLIGLAVISIAVWCTNHGFVLNVAASRLQTAASLKAAQLAQNLELMEVVGSFLTTRAVVQAALATYGNGTNTTLENFALAKTDITNALGDIGSNGRAQALQSRVFAQNYTDRSVASVVINATGPLVDPIQLPWNYSNGSAVYLGDDDLGYPAALYPNITIREKTDGTTNVTWAEYNGQTLNASSTLVLGPLTVNSTYSLLSLTLPVLNSTMRTDVLGWLTIVMDGRLIRSVIEAPEGLGETGSTLLLGPVNTTNHFRPGILFNADAGEWPNFLVHYLFPINESMTTRHPTHVMGTANLPFPAVAYPAVDQAVSQRNGQIDNTGTLLSTHNEANSSVSVGFSLAPTTMVDWIVLVEQAKSEVWEPIDQLRNIILACLFGVVGFFTLVSFPLAHIAILPIRRLRVATAETVDPLNRDDNDLSFEQSEMRTVCRDGSGSDGTTTVSSTMGGEKGVGNLLTKWRSRMNDGEFERRIRDDKPFRVPNKVRVRRHWVKDELTELTTTFNEMSDELFVQYARLEERVRERTAELELSKKTAEAANESKTLFIANISHELKTPLNGILGLCAVSLQEEDPGKVQQSLRIMQSTGDLLLRLLMDVLTFSRNQVEQATTLDEKSFKIRDIEEQAYAMFGEQAKARQISLSVKLESTAKVNGSNVSLAARGDGRTCCNIYELRNMALWGDIERINQVVMNLISNSLKFTPPKGTVTLTIRCLDCSSNPDLFSSRLSSQVRKSKTSDRWTSVVLDGDIGHGTANLIRPLEANRLVTHQSSRLRPPGADLLFEIEVQDTGSGIPESMHKRIFEPFVQASAGLSRTHGGTGLGLSICSQLASLMRGSMHVASKLNEGSTFTMQIPLRHVQVAECSSPILREEVAPVFQTPVEHSAGNAPMIAKENPLDATTRSDTSPGLSSERTTDHSDARSFSTSTTPLEHPGVTAPCMDQSQTNVMQKVAQEVKADAQESNRPVRVLVAEDNQLNQEVVLRMLKLEKITDVTVANDGQEALDLVKASMQPGVDNYDIIFMDVQMPNMDGLTSTKLIRDHGCRRPIVALTAFAAESNVKECYASGMDYFLAKPIRRPQLKKVLTEYCPPRAPASSSQTGPHSAPL